MVLEKVGKMLSQTGIDIPTLNIDTAHYIRPKKDKKRGVIAKFTVKFLDITRCCLESEKKLRIGDKLHVNVSKKLSLDAQMYV